MPGQPTHVGRYEILQQLGMGGMGAVYLGRDPLLDRLVAIKLLRTGFDNEEFRDRFTREARSIAKLHHPNLVAIFDVGEQDGEPFIAMEYVRGETLASIIRRGQAMTLAQSLKIIEEACDGLAYAHRAGIVHRDIKPANITIDEDGHTKILDFGLARSTQSWDGMTQAGVLLGTLGYVSPEQLTSGKVDPRSDIFALGVVLYEVIARERAFPGGVQDGILRRIMEETPRPLVEFRPDLPPEVDLIVSKSIEKNPDRRYADAIAMKRDLAAVRAKLQPEPDAALTINAPPLTPQPAIVPDGPATVGAAAGPFSPATGTIIASASSVDLSKTTKTPPNLIGRDESIVMPPPRTESAAPASDVQLVVTRSPDSAAIGRTVRITGRTFVLGRDDTCELTLKDTAWSRRHASIEETEDGFLIRDLDSKNGIYLNGRRVRDAAPLFFGATIAIGGTVLAFSYAKDTSLPDLTGTEVAGRYRLDRLLRDSAKAALYVAVDRNLPRKLVMKLMSPELVRYPGYRKLFEHEAETAASMHHPHICKVIDFGPVTITPRPGVQLRTIYLCVDMMPGGTLTERLESKAALALADTAKWVGQLADALEYTHRRGVCHGDLKPNAIVFDEDGNVFLTDFALAQRALNAEGRPASGTPAYMAPETWDAGVVTPATDQYALAALMYYVVTGSRPFEGQENPDVRQRNFRRGPIPAHEEAAENGRPDVPPAVSTVLAQALSTSPEGRYESVAAFARSFVEAAEGRRVGSPTVFLSYEREPNTAWAMYFNRELHDRNIRVFIDTERRDRAAQFPARLAEAIRTCDVFVCLLGGKTIDSKWVREEIRIAHQYKRPMIPVFQEDFDPKRVEAGADPALDALVSYDGVHLFDRRNVHVEHTVDDLARLVTNTVVKRR